MDPVLLWLFWILVVSGPSGLLYWLVHLLFKKRRNEAQRKLASPPQPSPLPAPSADPPLAPTPPPAPKPSGGEKGGLEDQIVEIGRSDPILAEILGRIAGRRHVGIQDMRRDSDVVQQIARAIDKNTLLLLRISANQTDLNFSDQRLEEQVPVPYPTRDMEPMPMTSLEQLEGLLPEQWVMEEDEFYAALTQNQLCVLQGMEYLVSQPLLYLLLDGSGSMKDPMPGRDVPKHIWARGVAVSLLLKAVRGQAEYMLRIFDAKPHERQQATNREEAIELILYLIKGGYTGGDTSILTAIRTAVDDIAQDPGRFSRAHVMLISDGLDNKVNSPAVVTQLLDKKTLLHVAMIGAHSVHLKGAATSYKVF